jgi:hypothetical protein
MFPLGESTTESKVSGQAGQKQGSRRVKGRQIRKIALRADDDVGTLRSKMLKTAQNR